MLFNSLQFAIFFAAVLALYRATPRPHRNGLLLAASLLFYTLWIPAYLLLLLADLGINYALVRAMRRGRRPRLYMAASILFTLVLLGYFKYAALFVETLVPVLSTLFDFTPPIPDLFLPLGISFYSFQIIAYTVDVYRRNLEPAESFSRYALFISFFPQLIAGPILRGREFLPQLETGGEMTAERNRRGVWLLASGLVKKVIFADFLLSTFVNDVFYIPEIASAPFHLIAVYSFAFQIYFDFSGYSDMARGLALLLGFEIPMNFREPYLSRNPAEFWQRWHITLSTWLRDYIYFPLSVAGGGIARAGVGLMITMFLGGLWHGAAWTFALWGLYHGALLALHRVASPFLSRIAPTSPIGSRLWHALCVVVTFQLICLGLAIFRASSFADAWLMIGNLLSGSYSAGWPVMQTAIVALCMAMHGIERALRPRLPRVQALVASGWWGPVAEGLALGAIVGLAIAVSGSGGEFIYFQF
jgi:alginate O-acetyltransferase complex protein AlgI